MKAIARLRRLEKTTLSVRASAAEQYLACAIRTLSDEDLSTLQSLFLRDVTSFSECTPNEQAAVKRYRMALESAVVDPSHDSVQERL